MRPRNSLKFLCLFVILLLSAISAPNNLSSPFVYGQAKADSNRAANVHLAAPINAAGFGLTATSDSPVGHPKHMGETVNFTATVTVNTKLTYQWTFGDGQTHDVGAFVKHVYTGNGTFSAKVIASDGTTSYEATTLVEILPQEPPKPPLPSGLSASCTTPVVASNPTICIASVKEGSDVIFSWDFGENKRAEQGSAISHIYLQPGSYVATVTSSSPSHFGYSERFQVIIQVTEEPISGLDIQGDSRLVVDTQGSFTAIIKTGTNVQYFWTFGDGTTGAGKTVSHTYTKPGVYDLTVVATNSVSSATSTKPIAVLPRLSDIFTIFNNSPKPVGEPITFIAVLNPPNTPATFYWNWGDGTSTKTSDFIVTHSYSASGKYPVTVKAIMSAGILDASTVAYVGVPSNEELLGVTITPQLIMPNQLIRFAVQDAMTSATYIWNFGDGSPSITDGPVVTHTFTAHDRNLVGTVTCTKCGEKSGKPTDFIERFGSELYLPQVLRFASISMLSINTPNPPAPTVTPTNIFDETTGLPTTPAPPVPAEEPTPEPSATPTMVPAAPTPTIDAPPTATDTPVPTSTPIPAQPTPTLLSTAPVEATSTNTPIPTETATLTPEPPTTVFTDTPTPTLIATAPVEAMPTETAIFTSGSSDTILKP